MESFVNSLNLFLLIKAPTLYNTQDEIANQTSINGNFDL